MNSYFLIEVDTFEKVHGLKAFMIAPTAIINGLGQSIGIDVIKVYIYVKEYKKNCVGSWNNRRLSYKPEFKD